MREEEYFRINEIQHFAFCKRQWGLIALEEVWEENADTRIGHFEHERTDDPAFTEVRGGKITVRALPIVSHRLQVTGIADVVEFIKDPIGISIQKHQGLYLPYAVEYKKGRPKKDHRDIVQLVAQVICLEEMFGVQIDESALYYKTSNRRQKVAITDALRTEVEEITKEMRAIFESGKTPKAEVGKHCKLCSLVDQCVPRLTHHPKNVRRYIQSEAFGDDEKTT